MAIFEQGHALIVGAGGDLPDTENDACGLAEMLRDPGRCAYPPEQVRLLCGAQATAEAFRRELQALAQRAMSQATVVVFFSGHGRLEQRPGKAERFFLLPYGYDLRRLEESALSGAEFTALLARIPASRLLLLLDCCHAGSIAGLDGWLAKEPGAGLSSAPLPPEALELLRQGSGRALIASSKEDELSFAGRPYSAFTLALLEALSGQGAARKDGLVRVADLALHARQMVPRRTGGRQTPILHFEQADNFAVAYYAAGQRQAKAPPFRAPIEIEPEPGAWRQQGSVQNFNSGSGPIILGDVKKYVAGDEIHVKYYEDRSVRYHGPASGNITITGDHHQLSTNSPVNLADLQTLLVQLQAGLRAAPLSPAEREELYKDLAAVQTQMAQPRPKGALIRKHLAGVVELLANSATIAVSAPQLVEQARQALEWARQLFGR